MYLPTSDIWEVQHLKKFMTYLRLRWVLRSGCSLLNSRCIFMSNNEKIIRNEWKEEIEIEKCAPLHGRDLIGHMSKK